MAKLFLIPTTLSASIDHSVLLPMQLAQVKHLKHFIVETPKIARSHIKYLELATPIQELNIYELNKHQQDLNNLIKPLLEGNDVGLMSDCGLPAIADPGSQMVKLAHKHNIEVVPFSGPNSLMMALMASGVSGQNFAFNGYLPVDELDRKKKLHQLQELVLKYGQSQIIIEAPFRNQQLLTSILDNLTSQITLSIAINLMQSSEKIISKTINQWKKSDQPLIHKQEVVFILGL